MFAFELSDYSLPRADSELFPGGLSYPCALSQARLSGGRRDLGVQAGRHLD